MRGLRLVATAACVLPLTLGSALPYTNLSNDTSFSNLDEDGSMPSGTQFPGLKSAAELQDTLQHFFKKLHFNSLLTSHESDLMSAQTQIMKSQEQQEALNRRLRSGQFTDVFLYDYASQSTEQTNAVLNSTHTAMKPYMPLLQRAVANFLVASYLNSVTSGANLYNSYVNNHKPSINQDNVAMISNMTSSYDGLVSISKFASLDAAILQRVNQNIRSLFKL